MTHNLSDEEYHDCRPHARGSVRRTSGFVLTGKPEVARGQLSKTGVSVEKLTHWKMVEKTLQ